MGWRYGALTFYPMPFPVGIVGHAVTLPKEHEPPARLDRDGIHCLVPHQRVRVSVEDHGVAAVRVTEYTSGHRDLADDRLAATLGCSLVTSGFSEGRGEICGKLLDLSEGGHQLRYLRSVPAGTVSLGLISQAWTGDRGSPSR